MKKPTNQLIKKNVKVFNDFTLVYQIMFYFFILNQFLKVSFNSSYYFD